MQKELFFNEKMPNIIETKHFSDSKKSKTLLHGEAEFRNEFGELLFKKSNIILVGGRRFTLEKLFNININPNQKITLNQIFHTNENEEVNPLVGPIQNKVVCLFGVGRGGSNLTFGSVINPNARENNLYSMVPMRYVNKANDLSTAERFKYYLKVDDGDYYAYYLKAFEATPTLVMKVGEQEFIPDATDNIPLDDLGNIIEREDVDVYIELQLKISANDIREYFQSTEGIDMARINELSLYFGYKPPHDPLVYTDYRGIETFSKLTFNNEGLDDLTKELGIIYRIYI